MNNIIIFYISTIPGGISIIYLLVNRKKLAKLMKRENPNYSGHVNNTIDTFRIIKTVSKSQTLSKAEKVFLIKVLALTSVSWLTGIIWIIFFSETILN